MLPIALLSNPRGVKARFPWCNQTATHPSQKSREGWGTHCKVAPTEGWATRRFNNGKNAYLFRDTMLKLIHSENLEYKELTKDDFSAGPAHSSALTSPPAL